MVARLQHLPGSRGLPIRRAGVLRKLQQPVRKAFLLGRGLIAQHPRQQPHRGVQHRLRRNLAAGQDEIAQGDLVDAGDGPARADPPPRTARTAASSPARRPSRAPWPDQTAARAATDRSPARPRSRAALQRRVQHIGAQHHARPTARRGVIDIAVLADAKGAQIDRLQPPQPQVQRLAGQDWPSTPGKASGNSVITCATQAPLTTTSSIRSRGCRLA